MSLLQSMYTGLAQPEVKMYGLPSEKCTASTSSIIFAVMSAMKDLSAKSMRNSNPRYNPLCLIEGGSMVGNFSRLALALLAAAPLVAGAQSFRCVGKDGKKYYGS